MRVKEEGKRLLTGMPKGKELKGDAGYVEGRGANKKLPKMPPKKEAYAKKK